MRPLVIAMSASLLFGGCWGDDEPSRSAEDTAQSWVDALNDQDYDRACDLSVVSSHSECVAIVNEKPFGEELEIEGFYKSRGEDDATFALSSGKHRQPRGKGWTAYAPVEGFRVERDGGEYKVHFEVSVIK
ncbi:MAG: hypothetical protein ACRDJY_07690 [Thermoleophilaceae bacterium]